MPDLFFEPHTCNSTAVLSSTGPVHSGDKGQLPLWPAPLPDWRDHSRYEKARRLRRLEGHPPVHVDATGTHRRLRALMAIGWRARDLAPRIGWQSGELDAIYRRRTVHTRTAATVARVYLELSDTPGPSEQTRRRAARAGYRPPIDWDDDTIDDPAVSAFFVGKTAHEEVIDQIAIDRYLDGDHTITLTREEKATALRQLVAKGSNPATAGGRLGINSVDARRYAADTEPPQVDADDVPRSPAVLSPGRAQDRRAAEKTSVGSCDRARNDHLEETG